MTVRVVPLGVARLAGLNVFTAINTFENTLVVDRAGDATAAVVEVRADAGQRKQLDFLTGSSLRWRFQTTVAAEAGSNVGTDWQIGRFDDSGVQIGTPLKVFRGTGHAYFGPNVGVVVSPGAVTDSTLGGATASVFVADGTAPSSNVAGGSMVYSQSGELKHRNPSGVVTNLTPASGSTRFVSQAKWGLD